MLCTNRMITLHKVSVVLEDQFYLPIAEGAQLKRGEKRGFSDKQKCKQ